MLKTCVAGAIALALLISSPAGTAQQTQAPHISDTVKFPRESVGVIRAVGAVNNLVNATMIYVSDQEHYGRDEVWVMMPPDGKGDCEDYALTKMELLRQAGVPVVAVARIRGVVVLDAKGQVLGAHAILELLLPGGSVAFLDNRFPELMTRSELEAHGYRFFDW